MNTQTIDKFKEMSGIGEVGPKEACGSDPSLEGIRLKAEESLSVYR